MKRLLATAILLAFCSAGLASAGGVQVKDSWVLNRWEITLGAFLSTQNTELRFDPIIEGGEGTTIDLEDDLGFSSSDTINVISAAFILGKRHQFELGFEETDRSGTVVLERDIEWGDEVFPIRAEVNSRYSVDMFKAGYSYWFYSSQRTAVAIKGGLMLGTWNTSIALAGSQILDQETEFKIDAPVPQLGMVVRHAFFEKFRGILGGSFVTFSDIDDLSGDVWNLTGALEYRVIKNLLLGGAYLYNNIDIDSGEKRALGNYTYTIEGLHLYMRIVF